MTRTELEQIIRQHPDLGAVPVECVLAFCTVESSLNEWAYRYEPGYKWIVGETLTPSERIGQMISWGLMQVMGGVAREHGMVGPFPQLCDPAIGLRYGLLHLRKYWAKHRNWPDTIASYNAGHPVRVDGKYKNQQYVDKVLKWWNVYERHVPLKESEA
jgi:hypothetical protein